MQATAYPYLRFSTPEQAEGDSTRRQETAFRRWAEINGAVLDDSLKLRDEGVSAFTGRNITHGGLGRFLDAARRGRLKPQAHFLVENLDRFSRLVARKAYRVFDELLELGVTIVDLSSGKRYGADSLSTFDLMEVLLRFERSNEESQRKSDALKEAWAEKRRNAKTVPLGATCPGWLRLDRVAGKYVFDRPLATVVRRIVRLAISGVGAPTIVRQLNNEGAPRLRYRAKRWETGTVNRLLRQRTLIGEYQPCRVENGRQMKDGEPVLGYYPALITEKEFYRLQAAFEARRTRPKGGRGQSTVPNLFGRLLVSGTTGSVMRLKGFEKKTKRRHMVSLNGLTGKEPFRSFPYDVFEQQFLGWVREVRLEYSDPAADRLAELEGRLAEVQHRLSEIQSELQQGGAVKLLAQEARRLEERETSLVRDLNAARAVAATPLPSTQEITLPETVEDRERMRALIPRLVRRIRVWINGDTARRSLVGDVEMADGRHRVFAVRTERGKTTITTAGTTSPINPIRYDFPKLATRLLHNAEAMATGRLRVTKAGAVVRYGRPRHPMKTVPD